MFNNNVMDKFTGIKANFLQKLSILPNNNKEVITRLVKVFDNIDVLLNEYAYFIDEFFYDDFRYVDYYDKSMTMEESLQYFNNSYSGADKDNRILKFSFYCLMDNLIDLLEMAEMDESFTLEELLELYNIGSYYEDLETFSSFLCERLKEKEQFVQDEAEEKMKLDFLKPDNKFLIYFTGFSLDDLKVLPRDKQMSLLHKLYSPLSTHDIIPNQDIVGHVKDTYNINIARIPFAKDYRVVYLRYLNVTAILGFGFKTGKDMDYFKFDYIAKRKEQLYREIEDFCNGDISLDSDHYKVVDGLIETVKRNKSK